MSKKIQTSEEITLNVALVIPVLSTNQRQTIYLRIGLTGFYLQTKKEPLGPVNMALVIDTSMSEAKLRQAKDAAMILAMQLRPTDRMAIVTNEHRGKVLLPSTKVGDREAIYQAIHTLAGSEQVNLLGGLKKGVREILKCRRHHCIDRMILLSDGFAEVALDSPKEVAKLASILEKNVAITTIGIGADYNKDSLMRLSQPSHGNHVWIENTTDAVLVFEHEFIALAWIVAQKVEVTLTGTDNVRPVSVLSRKAKIAGQTVSVRLNQVCSELEENIMVELEIPPIPNQQKQTLAHLTVAYHNLKTRRHQQVTQQITAIVVDSEPPVVGNTDASVMTVAIEPLVEEEEKEVLPLCEPDQIEEAKQLSLF